MLVIMIFILFSQVTGFKKYVEHESSWMNQKIESLKIRTFRTLEHYSFKRQITMV